jgi:uncharacterized protein YbbC (DUF1343 family)
MRWPDPSRRRTLGLLAAGAGGLVAGCAASPSPPPSDARGASAKVVLGVDRLIRDDFAALGSGRVGLVTNQTGVTGDGVLDRVAIQAGIGARLVSLFGPEHGLDTRVRAGERVPTARDAVTGLITHSLYGDHRKPTPAMLADLDVLVFDIQDIGSRSYTYISTLALAMEAAGEAGKRFVVLDRPNPLGGERVQGPPLLPGYESFVSQLPVPYVHGLTIGELARLMIARDWIKAKPALTVVAMEGWRRSMHWGETGLDWVATSPNVPRWTTSFHYPVTGILGELRAVDIGVNTPRAFEVAAARGVDGARLADDLSAMGFDGARFTPWTSPARPGFAGVEIALDPAAPTDLVGLAVALCLEVNARAGGEPWRESPAGTRDLFDKVWGAPSLSALLAAGATDRSALTAGWPSFHAAFRRERADALLYA